MRAPLKGINTVRRRLADGRMVTYHYAWRGGPRLPGKPGDPEFLAAYAAAVRDKTKRASDNLGDLLVAYQRTTKFNDLSAFTRRDYLRQITKIEKEFGDFPVAALADRRARNTFLNWRDRMATKSRRQADYAFAVLALILSWAFDRGLAPANPCERPGKVYRSQRAEIVWTPAQEAAFLAVAPPHIALAFMLALWTGQRQGDLLRLPWTAYDGTSIRLKQGKTGKRVTIPVATPLKAMLDATPKKALTILTTARPASDGVAKPWTQDGFRASWAKVIAKAGISGVTFHDLRGTAVTRLALAGSTVPEIAAITGHALKEVESILDAHYLARDGGLAENAIRKREKHEAGTGICKTNNKTPS